MRHRISIDVFGRTHLAQTLMTAAAMRGIDAYDFHNGGDLKFAAADVEDHADLAAAEGAFRQAMSISDVPVILASQVPPGTTRAWAGEDAPRVFCQVDTIIMREALPRAYAPEQFIVGSVDPEAPLPLAYQEYLMAFGCPWLQTSYESAELAKCAINYVLAKQIEAANDLAAAAKVCGAHYTDVAAIMHGDARIGRKAYLRPGRTNQHLDRDIRTVCELAGINPSAVAEAQKLLADTRERLSRLEIIQQRELKLSDAYLRLREMIPGAFNTPHAPSPEQVWETTEGALRALLESAEQGAHAED